MLELLRYTNLITSILVAGLNLIILYLVARSKISDKNLKNTSRLLTFLTGTTAISSLILMILYAMIFTHTFQPNTVSLVANVRNVFVNFSLIITAAAMLLIQKNKI